MHIHDKSLVSFSIPVLRFYSYYKNNEDALEHFLFSKQMLRVSAFQMMERLGIFSVAVC